jgi:lipopolysaccharide transport system permease protein
VRLNEGGGVRKFLMSCWRHRHLLQEMTKRELSEKHAGQILGATWAIAHPLFLMALYVFIFSVVFKLRIGGSRDLPLDYTAYILSGLVPWLSCLQVLTKSTVVFKEHKNLIKQVIFPIEILPTKVVLASLVPQLIGLVVLAIYVTATNGYLFITWWLVPLLMTFQMMFVLGVAFALASVGAFISDMRELVQLFTLVGAYVMPVFFLPAWVPALFRPILWLNPFSYLIWCYQDALYFGRFEHPMAWLVLAVMAPASFVAGYKSFLTLRPHFLGSL